MSASATLTRLKEDMKTAMRQQQKERLRIIRMALAAVKQKEIDERVTVTDEDMLIILDKLIKQRRESINHYQQANREDLVKQEQLEIDVLKDYLPEPLNEEEIQTLIKEAITNSNAQGMQDMGKVMGQLKTKLQGRADMGQVSQKIKALLS